MHIIFVTSSSTASGGARQAVYLARALAGLGHDVTFLAPADSALPALVPARASEIAWRELPTQRRRWRRAVEAAMPAPSSGKACVVHAFHNRAVKRAAWWGLRWRLRPPRGARVVVVGHRGVIYRPNNPLPYWSPGLDAFFVNSKACATVLAAKGVGPRRLFVVPNGIPPERVTPLRGAAAVRAELGCGLDDVLLGTVANDSANKGLDVLLEAVARLARPEAQPAMRPEARPVIRLVALGVTPARFQGLCRDLGIAERVRLLTPRENVAEYLAAMDVFVLPSRSESMPNTLLEATCLGLPVVATAVGGVPECVEGNGLLVPPGDVGALTQALGIMLADSNYRQRCADAARGLAPRYSLARKARAVEAIYQELLARRGVTL